jgi:hypothetical protein
MNNVRNHFEEEAHEFDQIIIKLFPYYAQMLDVHEKEDHPAQLIEKLNWFRNTLTTKHLKLFFRVFRG